MTSDSLVAYKSTRKMLTLPLDIAVSGGGRLANTENWSRILAPLQRSGTGRFRFRYTRPTGSQETYYFEKGAANDVRCSASARSPATCCTQLNGVIDACFLERDRTLDFSRLLLFSFTYRLFVYPSLFYLTFDFFPPIFHCIFITYVWYNFRMEFRLYELYSFA